MKNASMKIRSRRAVGRCRLAPRPQSSPRTRADDQIRFGAECLDAARRHLLRRGRRRRDQFARRHLRLHAHRPPDDVDGDGASIRARRLAAVPVRSQRANSRARSARACTAFCSPPRSASIRRTTSGSSTRFLMVMKFDPQGRVAFLLGRKPESIQNPAAAGGAGAAVKAAAAAAALQEPARRRTSSIGRPTSRGTRRATSSSPTAAATRASPSSRRTACSSSRGAREAPRPASSPASTVSPSMRRATSTRPMAGNERIQVFDNNGTFKTEIKNVGNAQAICITPGREPGAVRVEFESAERSRYRAVRSTRCASTERWSASSAGRASC